MEDISGLKAHKGHHIRDMTKNINMFIRNYGIQQYQSFFLYLNLYLTFFSLDF